MLDYLGGTPRRLDVGFTPSPSGGQMYFWQEEEVHNCFLVMLGYTPDFAAAGSIETSALITGVGFVQSVFGYPNEDAFWKDPRGELGHGCYEIEGSQWEANLNDYNRRSFGDAYSAIGPLHHYFVGSKDGSCQILARDLQVEVFPAGWTFNEVIEESQRRMNESRTEAMRVIQEMIDRPPPPN
jgi:hypothetical protein